MTNRLVAATAIAAAFVVVTLEVTAQTTPKAGGATAVEKGSMRFQHLDLDHDGKLSREEASKSTYLSKHFDEVDTNHDGFITPDEKRTAWKARMAARNKPKAGQAPAGAMALGQRREGWAFAAGLGINLAVSLLFWNLAPDIFSIPWFIRLVQVNALPISALDHFQSTFKVTEKAPSIQIRKDMMNGYELNGIKRGISREKS